MPFYEVIYDDGTYSILSGPEKEILDGLQTHHERAVNETDPTANRVVKILQYKTHPGDIHSDFMIPTEEALAIVHKHVSRADKVNVSEVISSFRLALSPLLASKPEESNYKMEEVKELEPEWLAA